MGWSQNVKGTMSQHVRSSEVIERTLQPVLQGDINEIQASVNLINEALLGHTSDLCKVS
jgi:hypothetical protein